MSAFEDYINTELPRRRVLLVPDLVGGYDDDPNDGGAPSALQLAPVGAWYYRESTSTLYQKLLSGTDTWTLTGTDRSFTTISIAVDSNDGSAVNPPAGAVYRSQAEVDAVLGGNPAKDIRLWWDALPSIIDYDVTFTVAGGVHRPDASSPVSNSGFYMTAKEISSGVTVYINGVTHDSWNVEAGFGSLSVDSHSTTTSLAPFIDMSTSHPGVFSGEDFRSMQLLTNTGELLVIHDHTDDILYTTLNPSAPITSISIVRPATIFRNSTDDSSPLGTSSLFFFEGISGEGALEIHDVDLQEFSCTFGCYFSFKGEGNVRFYQTLMDKKYQLDQFSVTPNNRCVQADGDGVVYFYRCGLKSTPATNGADEPLYFSNPVCFLFDTVIYGFRDYLLMRSSSLYLGNAVIRKCGDAHGYSILQSDSYYFFYTYVVYNYGCGNIIGDEKYIMSNVLPVSVPSGLHLQFEGQSGECALQLSDGTYFDTTAAHASAGVRAGPGGGNSVDYAIKLVGTNNKLLLGTGTHMGGDVNDFQSDDEVGGAAYTDIIGSAASPDLTSYHNQIGRG